MRGFGRRLRGREGRRIPLVLPAAILLLVVQWHLPAVLLAGDAEADLLGSPDLEFSLLPPKLIELSLPGAAGDPLALFPSERLAQLLLSRGPMRPRPPPSGDLTSGIATGR